MPYYTTLMQQLEDAANLVTEQEPVTDNAIDMDNDDEYVYADDDVQSDHIPFRIPSKGKHSRQQIEYRYGWTGM